MGVPRQWAKRMGRWVTSEAFSVDVVLLGSLPSCFVGTILEADTILFQWSFFKLFQSHGATLENLSWNYRKNPRWNMVELWPDHLAMVHLGLPQTTQTPQFGRNDQFPNEHQNGTVAMTFERVVLKAKYQTNANKHSFGGAEICLKYPFSKFFEGTLTTGRSVCHPTLNQRRGPAAFGRRLQRRAACDAGTTCASAAVCEGFFVGGRWALKVLLKKDRRLKTNGYLNPFWKVLWGFRFIYSRMFLIFLCLSYCFDLCLLF